MSSTPAQVHQWRVAQKITLSPETEPLLAGYKEPLTKVMEGYGYIGTLTFDKEHQTHVQCHICGYFFKGLGHHIIKTHAMTIRDYKDRFGLMRTTRLTAPYSKLHELGKHLNKSLSPEQKAKRLENLRLAWEHRYDVSAAESMEEKNKKGTCPEQLLRKILELSEALDKTPTRREFIHKYGDNGTIKSVYRTFGTWDQAVKELGLVPNERGRK